MNDKLLADIGKTLVVLGDHLGADSLLEHCTVGEELITIAENLRLYVADLEYRHNASVNSGARQGLENATRVIQQRYNLTPPKFRVTFTLSEEYEAVDVDAAFDQALAEIESRHGMEIIDSSTQEIK